MGTPTATVTATTVTPATVPCTIATPYSTFGVTGIPGAAAAVSMLIRDYGFVSTRWMPNADVTATPYAFVALRFWTHVIWFRPGVYVAPFERVGCGREFSTALEPLLFDHRAPGSLGACPHCLSLWRVHYDQH